MDLFIIRHGQSEADILNVMEGRADFNLTPLGYKQAELMAEWLTSQDGIFGPESLKKMQSLF